MSNDLKRKLSHPTHHLPLYHSHRDVLYIQRDCAYLLLKNKPKQNKNPQSCDIWELNPHCCCTLYTTLLSKWQFDKALFPCPGR